MRAGRERGVGRGRRKHGESDAMGRLPSLLTRPALHAPSLCGCRPHTPEAPHRREVAHLSRVAAPTPRGVCCCTRMREWWCGGGGALSPRTHARAVVCCCCYWMLVLSWLGMLGVGAVCVRDCWFFVCGVAARREKRRERERERQERDKRRGLFAPRLSCAHLETLTYPSRSTMTTTAASIGPWPAKCVCSLLEGGGRECTGVRARLPPNRNQFTRHPPALPQSTTTQAKADHRRAHYPAARAPVHVRDGAAR